MTAPDDDNQQAVQRLVEAGVDVTKPQHIEFTVDVPDEASGAAIAHALTCRGYDCSVEFDPGEPDVDPEDGPAWTVYAARDVVPDPDALTRCEAEIQEVADGHGGTCDGWGMLA